MILDDEIALLDAQRDYFIEKLKLKGKGRKNPTKSKLLSGCLRRAVKDWKPYCEEDDYTSYVKHAMDTTVTTTEDTPEIKAIKIKNSLMVFHCCCLTHD